MDGAGKRAIVIGGSMSGLFAGLQLRARGFAVDIYERVESELSGRGAGIVAQPNVPRAMRALGIDTADLGVEMTTRKILDAEGRTVVEMDCPQTLTAWERLYRILRDAFPARHYHRGVGLKGFEQSDAAVTRASRRRPQRRSRSAGRRRRHPLDRAPAAPARPQSALCRLCRLARAHPRAGHPARDPPRAVRVHDLLPAARRAVPRLSGGRSRQRPAARPPPLQRGLVSPGRRRHRIAAPAHRRERRHAFALDSAAADPTSSTSRRCAPPPSAWWRRNSAPSRG